MLIFEHKLIHLLQYTFCKPEKTVGGRNRHHDKGLVSTTGDDTWATHTPV